tara:strand:+ start:6060 stop:7343 length:1284 start_codon:yes stop_codon:yes gene_type:complete
MFAFVVLASSGLLFLLVVKIYDVYLQRTLPPVSPDLETTSAGLRDLFLYPYTGKHTGANAHLQGPMSSENSTDYEDFDIKSGDHGFFVDFDLDNPPPKGEGEFRIILIGGSSAQGYGAQRNSEMIHEVLERSLNSSLSGDVTHTVRVINLAMAGSISEQNAGSVNLWGVRLEPDLVISFSGGNDVAFPTMQGTTVDTGLFNCRQTMPVARLRPAWFNNLASVYPGLLLHSSAGLKLLDRLSREVQLDEVRQRHRRAHNADWYFNRRERHHRVLTEAERRRVEKAQRDFKGPEAFRDRISPDPPHGQPTTLERVARKSYVDAFKSIKRDLRGVPIILAFQPIDWRHAFPTYEGIYQRDWIQPTKKDLSGYYNDEWYFIDLHTLWSERGLWEGPELYYGVHMVSRQQKIVAEELAKVATPLVQRWAKSN